MRRMRWSRYDCTSVCRQRGRLRRNSCAAIASLCLSDRAVRQYAQDETVYNSGLRHGTRLSRRVYYLPDGNGHRRGLRQPSRMSRLPAFGKFFLQNVREKIITFPALQQGALRSRCIYTRADARASDGRAVSTCPSTSSIHGSTSRPSSRGGLAAE
jgi:hypothetical protein